MHPPAGGGGPGVEADNELGEPLRLRQGPSWRTAIAGRGSNARINPFRALATSSRMNY